MTLNELINHLQQSINLNPKLGAYKIVHVRQNDSGATTPFNINRCRQGTLTEKEIFIPVDQLIAAGLDYSNVNAIAINCLHS